MIRFHYHFLIFYWFLCLFFMKITTFAVVFKGGFVLLLFKTNADDNNVNIGL